MTTALDEIDMEALRRAMDVAMRDPRTAEWLKAKLNPPATEEHWIEVAMDAAGHCQRRDLGLKPWQDVPCNGRDDDTKAARILKRLLAANLSQWEPNPISALAKGEQS